MSQKDFKKLKIISGNKIKKFKKKILQINKNEKIIKEVTKSDKKL